MRRIDFLLCATLCQIAPALAQKPAFDVASVHPDQSDARPSVAFSPGRMKVQGVSLRVLITVAYKIRGFQLSGGPSWLDSQRYAIEARSTTQSADDMLLMLQALLEDRFGLVVHRQTKEGPVYELTVAKGGARLRTAACLPFDPSRLLDQTRKSDEERAGQCGGIDYRANGADHSLDSRGARLQDGTGPAFQSISGQLSLVLDRPVIDRTGLDGVFELHLHWISLEPPVMPGASGADAPDDSAGLSIFTALREQTGLQLENGRGPVDYLVIDRVEKPAEN